MYHPDAAIFHFICMLFRVCEDGLAVEEDVDQHERSHDHHRVFDVFDVRPYSIYSEPSCYQCKHPCNEEVEVDMRTILIWQSSRDHAGKQHALKPVSN